MLLQNPIHHDAIFEIQGTIHATAIQLLHGIINLGLVDQDLINRASIALDVISAIHLTNFDERVSRRITIIRMDSPEKGNVLILCPSL